MDAVFSFCMNMAAWQWMSLGVAFFAFELMFPGIFMVWFGISGLLTSALVYLVGFSGASTVVIFLILSVAVSVFGHKYQNKKAKFYVENVGNMVMGKTITLHDPITNGHVLFKYIIAVNHFNNELTIIENLLEGETSNIADIEEILSNNNIATYEFQAIGEEKSDISNEDYKKMVAQGKKECFKGNVFQIVLSRRFYQQYKGDDFMLYRTLRSVNPSPYLFYFNFGDFRIFGSPC